MAKDKVYTAEMGKPPQDIDGKSAGKVDKKDAPEQPGSGILVDGKPLKRAHGGTVKAKRFNFGGQVDGAGVGTYPFPSTGQSGPATNTTVNVGGVPATPVDQQNSFVNAAPQAMKKGGKVTVSRRGDGLAQRGKTKGRLV